MRAELLEQQFVAPLRSRGRTCSTQILVLVADCKDVSLDPLTSVQRLGRSLPQYPSLALSSLATASRGVNAREAQHKAPEWLPF